jgi:hypothetical protein
MQVWDLHLALFLNPHYQFDNMSEPRHRKLTAMGLASLVSTGRPEVLGRIPNEISNLWLDVFGEIKEQERLEEEGTGFVRRLIVPYHP